MKIKLIMRKTFVDQQGVNSGFKYYTEDVEIKQNDSEYEVIGAEVTPQKERE